MEDDGFESVRIPDRGKRVEWSVAKGRPISGVLGTAVSWDDHGPGHKSAVPGFDRAGESACASRKSRNIRADGTYISFIILADALIAVWLTDEPESWRPIVVELDKNQISAARMVDPLAEKMPGLRSLPVRCKTSSSSAAVGFGLTIPAILGCTVRRKGVESQ